MEYFRLSNEWIMYTSVIGHQFYRIEVKRCFKFIRDIPIADVS